MSEPKESQIGFDIRYEDSRRYEANVKSTALAVAVLSDSFPGDGPCKATDELDSRYPRRPRRDQLRRAGVFGIGRAQPDFWRAARGERGARLFLRLRSLSG